MLRHFPENKKLFSYAELGEGSCWFCGRCLGWCSALYPGYHPAPDQGKEES
jgi:hypothetical protein